MNVERTAIGDILAALSHIAAIKPNMRTESERYWMLMVETNLTRIHRKIPLHLRDLAAVINVTLGRMVEESPPPESPKQGA